MATSWSASTPIVYLDALIVKIRDGHTVKNQRATWRWASTSTASVTCSACGSSRPKARRVWLHVLTDLKTRTSTSCSSASTGSRFRRRSSDLPRARPVDFCLVHQVRSSMRFKDREAARRRVAQDLHRRRRRTHRRRAHSVHHYRNSSQLARALGADHPVPGLPRRRPPRDLHHQLDRSPTRQTRKIIKTRGSPTEDAARKLIYLGIHQSRDQMEARVGQPPWPTFEVDFGDRIPDN